MLNSHDFDNLLAISNLLNEHNKRQGVAYSAVTYSHPLAGPSNHKWGPETHLEKPREKKYQPIHTDSAHSNVLRHRLHVPHARDGTGHADIHAAARCAEVEATESKLRAELATAMNRAQTIQEQSQHQTKLALSKDHTIQSITEEAQVAQTKLKDAVVKIVRLSLDLRLERILRLRERDNHSDQQAKMRDRHEDEIRCIAQEAHSVQEKLAALHDLQSRIRTASGQQPSVSCVHLPCAPSPLPEAVYAGERPTSSRGIPRTDKPPGSPAINSNSTCSTEMERDPSHHDWGDPPTLQGDHLLQISACFDQVSHVANAHVAAVEELLERICQLEAERARHVTLTGPDHHSLERELAATMEKLHLAEEEVLTLRRNLDQSRDMMWEVKSQARDLAHELEMCQAELKESKEKRRAGNIRFVKIVERLDRRSAALQSSRAEVEELRDRRLRETKELLDERARIQDRYEAEIHLIARDAREAQEQLIALRGELSRLRAGGQSPLHCALPFSNRHPTAEPVDRDTGQPLLPPEPCLDAGTPLLSYASDAKSNEPDDRHLERVTELEAEVKTFKSTQKSSERIAPRTESCSIFPMDRETGMGSP